MPLRDLPDGEEASRPWGVIFGCHFAVPVTVRVIGGVGILEEANASNAACLASTLARAVRAGACNEDAPPRSSASLASAFAAFLRCRGCKICPVSCGHRWPSRSKWENFRRF
jgi:hypothetical protein